MSSPRPGAPRRRFVSIAYTHAPSDPRIRRECETAARAGWQVVQIGLATPGERTVGHLNGVVLIRLKRKRYRGGTLLRYAWAYLGFLLWARRILRILMRRGGIRAVQVTNLPNFLVWAATPARRAGIGVILDIRDPVPELFHSKFGHRSFSALGVWALRREEVLACRAADLVVTVNEPHRRLTAEHGVPAAKLRVILNTADAILFPLQQPRSSTPSLAYHGTVAERMGLDVVLGAIASLRTEGLGIRLAIWGDGDAVAELRAVRDRLGLASAVELTGQRFRMDELIPRLATIGVGLVPLRRDRFTDVILSTKLMEYARLGIPAVVMWTPTQAHYFPDDTVTYVREHTVAAWADAIRRVLANPGDAQTRAERAQRLPAAQAWQATEAEYLALIDEVARGPATTETMPSH
jgi:glycosyltransferase involved in cell wall biosynthesis